MKARSVCNVSTSRLGFLALVIVVLSAAAGAEDARELRDHDLRQWFRLEFPTWTDEHAEALLSVLDDLMNPAAAGLAPIESEQLDSDIRTYLRETVSRKLRFESQLDIEREKLRLAVEGYLTRPKLSAAQRQHLDHQKDTLLSSLSSLVDRALVRLRVDKPEVIAAVEQARDERVKRIRDSAGNCLNPFWKLPVATEDLNSLLADAEAGSDDILRGMLTVDVERNPAAVVDAFFRYLPYHQVSSPALLEYQQKYFQEVQRHNEREMEEFVERRQRQRTSQPGEKGLTWTRDLVSGMQSEAEEGVVAEIAPELSDAPSSESDADIPVAASGETFEDTPTSRSLLCRVLVLGLVVVALGYLLVCVVARTVRRRRLPK